MFFKVFSKLISSKHINDIKDIKAIIRHNTCINKFGPSKNKNWKLKSYVIYNTNITTKNVINTDRVEEYFANWTISGMFFLEIKYRIEDIKRKILESIV